MARSLPVVGPGASAAGPPPFDRIGVVGLGLIGGSVALACRRAWPSTLVIGVDRNEVIEAAVLRHAIDVAADDLGMLREAQLVVLAAPVLQNVELVGALSDAIPGEALVTDVGSTKRTVVEAATRLLPARLRFVGGHPLAGAARSGIEYASPELFHGRPWILTPADTRESAADIEALAAWVAALGAVPRLLSPGQHDRLVAFLSHLPQLAATALMRVIGEAAGEEGLALAGRGLADTTRLASSPAAVWTEICASNADEIGGALDVLIAQLEVVRAHLEDPEVLTTVFDTAAAWRERVPTRGSHQPGH